MILQELVRFYERKLGEEVPLVGFSDQSIRYILEINLQGKLLSVQDREVKEGKKNRVPLLKSPTIPVRSSGIKAGFIVDQIKYVFGAHLLINYPKHSACYQALLQECYEATQDEGLKAYLLFLDSITENDIPVTLQDAKPELNIGIRIFEDFGKADHLWDRLELRNWYCEKQQLTEGKIVSGQCLISGQQNVSIQRTHEEIPFPGTPKGKAPLISLNTLVCPAFSSYGKEQSYNAPVSVSAENAYVSALRDLYNKESTQKLRMAGTVLAFWADGKTAFEQAFPSYFEGFKELESSDTIDEASAVREAQGIFKAPHTGYLDLDVYRNDNTNTQFYVLGLSPNSARLSVRFWYQGSVFETAQRMNQHLSDLAIVHGPDEPDMLSLLSLLRMTAFEYKMDNINPRLQTEMMRAILQGTPYPVALLQAVLHRIKAERRVGYKRAALLKAYFNRYYRYYCTEQQPLGEIMDEQNMNPAYRLGRLFAILERLQEQALGSVNAGIRDRYYNSAATTPRAVFGRLIKLSHHHLGKLSGGEKIWYSQLIGQALDPISPTTSFPAYFTLEEQGLFALGYYHQRQWFFTKKAPDVPIETSDLITNN